MSGLVYKEGGKPLKQGYLGMQVKDSSGLQAKFHRWGYLITLRPKELKL